MSTLPISLNALAAVRDTLIASFYWRENDENHCSYLFDVFANRPSHNYVTESEAKGMVENFVNLAYIFNAISYFKGEQAKTNEEPDEWGCALEALKSTRGKTMTLVQLFKTIQCIDYNTDVESWLQPGEYYNWKRKYIFEEFNKTIMRINVCLGNHIIGQTEEYKAAKWDY